MSFKVTPSGKVYGGNPDKSMAEADETLIFSDGYKEQKKDNDAMANHSYYHHLNSGDKK